MLRTNDNIYVAGHHIFKPHIRDQMIEEEKPTIVCIDKPQDLQKYADQIWQGQRTDDVVKQLEQDMCKGFNISLFVKDYVPLIETCKRAGVKELHFISVPVYVEQITPFYIPDQAGIVDQVIREGIMSIRAKEIQIKIIPTFISSPSPHFPPRSTFRFIRSRSSFSSYFFSISDVGATF